jgi:PQQ-dependent catabolism-associated CXXCW motif protein
MLMIAGAVALSVAASQFMSGGGEAPTNEAATNETVTNETVAVDTKGNDASPRSERNYAGELDNLGVPSKATLESNVGSATPLQIPVGTRISTDGLQQLLAKDSSALLIDVLDNSHPTTIRDAAYLPAAGKPGTFDDQHQSTAAAELRRLVAGQANRPLIFFCAGAACWESYNAVLRANAAGYKNLYWYRGGLASWNAAGLPMQPLQPSPAGMADIF